MYFGARRLCGCAQDGFIVYRRSGAGIYRSVTDTSGGGIKFFVDMKAVTAGSKYCYRVLAFNFNKSSARSAEVSKSKPKGR